MDLKERQNAECRKKREEEEERMNAEGRLYPASSHFEELRRDREG